MHEAPLFTVHDHLRVQRQIEERANDLWRAGGCSGQSAFSDWLQAEREVLEEFVLAYALRRSARRQPGRRPKAVEYTALQTLRESEEPIEPGEAFGVRRIPPLSLDDSAIQAAEAAPRKRDPEGRPATKSRKLLPTTVPL